MTSILVITSLFPNSVEARHGIFVETRLRQLLSEGGVHALVIAPVPWFPFKLKAFPEYSKFRDIPAQECRNGITVHHPRYVVIPRIGMLFTPFFMAISVLLKLKALRKSGYTYDIVDAHYYYPDGVAVALISGFLKKPFFVTARGTDINLIADISLPRKMILWAARRAAGTITVCQALKDRMVELGAEAGKIHVLRNGVDLQKFRPLARDGLRERHGLHGQTLLSVGHLIERKGHNHVIDALPTLPGMKLIIAGDGEEERSLKAQVERLKLNDRVDFVGAVTQDELAELYNACDILVLASSREGWANVLLESLACGTPVVATRIWGTPEVIREEVAGILVEERSGKALAKGVFKLLDRYPERVAVRAYAERFSWSDTTAGIRSLFGVDAAVAARESVYSGGQRS